MLARKSLLILTANIIEGILAYVYLFFISRYMGPEDYGIIIFAMGFVGLFTVIGNFGFRSAHIKQVSEGKDLGTCNGTYMTSKIFLTTIMTLVVLSAIYFWKNIIGRGFESSYHEIAIYIMLGYFIIRGISEIFQVTFRAKKEIAKSEIPIIIRAITKTIAITYVAVSGFGPIELAFAYVLGDFFFLLASMILFKGYPIKTPSKEYIKNYVQFAMPLIIVSTSLVIMTNLDKVLIQLFWTAENVGYYGASYRITQFIILATSSLGILLFPTISGLYVNKNISKIKKITFQAERYISMLVFPIVIGLIFLAEPAVKILLSRDFYPATQVLRILPFFALIQALTIPYNYQLIGMNKPKLARNRVIIMVIINIVLNIILIPKDIKLIGIDLFGLGAVGAAIATVISYGIGLIYCRLATLKVTGKIWNPKILLHMFSALIMGLILHILNIQFPIDRWYNLLIFAIIGIGIYLFLLFLLKEFKRDDILLISDTLNIKKMGEYIKGEIKKK